METIPLLPPESQGPGKSWKVLQLIRAGQTLSRTFGRQQGSQLRVSSGLDSKG